MESRDQRAGAVSSLVRILRKITRIVQIVPFAYLLLLAIYLVGESFLPEWSIRILDNIIDTPAYVTAGMLGAGRILKLCSWFRAACILPFATKAEGYIDAFVYTFTQNDVIIINVITGVVFISFIFFSLRHFFHDGRAEK